MKHGRALFVVFCVSVVLWCAAVLVLLALH